MVGKVAASARDPGTFRAGRMKLNRLGSVDQLFADGAGLILHISKQVFESDFGVIKRSVTGFDEPLEVGGDQRTG